MPSSSGCFKGSHFRGGISEVSSRSISQKSRRIKSGRSLINHHQTRRERLLRSHKQRNQLSLKMLKMRTAQHKIQHHLRRLNQVQVQGIRWRRKKSKCLLLRLVKHELQPDHTDQNVLSSSSKIAQTVTACPSSLNGAKNFPSMYGRWNTTLTSLIAVNTTLTSVRQLSTTRMATSTEAPCSTG